jgi:tight adherence protein C
METILNIFIGADHRADGAMLFGAVFFTFIFMFCFVLAVTDMVHRRSDIRKRTSFERNLHSPRYSPEQPWETTERSLRFQSYAENTALLSSVERGQKNGEHETEKTKLQRSLVSAGFFGPNNTLWFQAIRLGLLGGLPLVAHVLIVLGGMTISHSAELGILTALGGVGFLLPGRYIVQRQKAMRQQCRNGFPDFMDLMVVCAEAGLSPRAAIDRISREIAHSYPYLGANLYLMSLELRAGGSLAAAVESLARRTSIEEVANLGSLLSQTEQLGTSLTDALRIYSDEMRDKRLSRAEEKAHALPVKLTLPLGIYIFPVMLVVIALPIFIRIRHALF